MTSSVSLYRRIIGASAAVALAAAAFAQPPVSAETPTELAQQSIRETGTTGGLVVHLGCGNGSLIAALADGGKFLLHGLDSDRSNVEQARRRLKQAGLYGTVSVEQFSGTSLPYADEIVNLLVCEDQGEVSEPEILRVLCPLGAAYLKRDGRWQTIRKPWPAQIDDWTHFLHDASNNAVAADQRVGPPQRLRWVCGPLWSRSHEFNSSLCAMVSAKGRIFYVFDEGLTSITDAPIPQRWVLIARDAFNGVLLWKRPIDAWGAGQWPSAALRSVPETIPRLLVAQGDRVFMTLGYGTAVSALDAATGQVITTYDGTEGTDEFRAFEEFLLVRKGKTTLAVLDTNTGETLWQADGKIQALTPAVQHGKVFYQDGQSLVCRHLVSGEELWQVPLGRVASMLIAHDDRLLLIAGSDLQAVSAKNGQTLWTQAAGVKRREMFVAADQLWHWEGDLIVGRNIDTGEVKTRPDTSDVFTPGHHLRCYQTKATENFLITPYRGVEFISTTGEDHSQHDWVRGSCRYGVMPAAGLLYVPPHPCFCYPGVKLTGLNALAAEEREGEEGRGGDRESQARRLHRGPAYDPESYSLQPPTSPASWPTYRHDARRTGAAACKVATQVARRWQTDLGGRLSPPVSADGRVYVAVKDRHTLHALSIEDGSRLWEFTANGPIDSPPSIHGELVLFGSADGHVYCIRAADGEFVWRFQAAPSAERIVAFGQLESPWRVHGSILIYDGVAYCTAGRSSYLDGGIWVYGLNPQTGQIVYEAHLDTWSPTRDDAVGKPFVPSYHMEGTHSDVLVSQGDYIYLGQVKFNRKLEQQEVPYVLPDPNDKTVSLDLYQLEFIDEDKKTNTGFEVRQREWIEKTQKELRAKLHSEHGSHNLGDRDIGLHVFSPAGFLDDAYFNRTFWMYSGTWPGFYLAHRAAKTGQLLVVGDQKTYAVQAFPSRNFQSPLFTPGDRGYLLFADRNDNEPVLDHRTRGTTKGWGFTRTEPPVWHDWVPIRIRGLVLADQQLFAAGVPDVVDPDDPMAAFEGRKGALLRTVSATDGKTLAEQKLDAPPVFDGLIATDGRLLMSTTAGQVICMGSQ